MLLLANGIIGSVFAVENDADDLSVIAEVKDNEHVVEVPDKSEGNAKEESNDTSVSGQKRKSVKMIVGGQSTDGLAKEVIVPVKD